MNYILVVFTCVVVNGNYDGCPVEATEYQDISYDLCEQKRIEKQAELDEDQIAKCIEIDYE